jgi:hypothetical protein
VTETDYDVDEVSNAAAAGVVFGTGIVVAKVG